MHARMRDFIINWIATVAMLPRDDKKHHTQFPLYGGGAAQRRGGQRMQESIATLPHTLSLVIASHRRWRGNPVNYAPRVCDTYHKSLSICWGMALSGMIFSPIVFINKNTAVINGGWRLRTIEE